MNPVRFAARVLRYWKRNGQYWTVGKAVNALLAQAALRLKLRYVPAGPVVAKLEATNICNGTCRLCPVGRKEPGHRPYGVMAWDLYTTLVDKLKDTVVTLDLTNWGESLLHPRVLDMVRYAHRRRMYTYLSTNLHTVRPHHIDGLMTCGLDELALSLHGLSEETYQSYQPGFAFAEACDLIDRLTDARRRLSRDGKPKIKVNFVVTAVNEHEAPDLPAFAERYGVEYVLSEPSLNLRFQIDPATARRDPDKARAIIRDRINEWLPRQGKHDRPLYRALLDDPSLLYSGAKQYPCDWPWTKLVVNQDGGMSICCGSYKLTEDLATFAGQPIRQLWNSKPYRQCRASFAKPSRARRPGRTAPNRPPRTSTDFGSEPVLCEQCPGLLL